jgi:hypothetical protein
MCLKNKIETTLCVLKNGEYKILSQKLRVINTLFINEIVNYTKFLDEYNPKLVDRVRYILKSKDSINTCIHCSKPIIDLNKMFCSTKCNNNSEQTKNKFRENYQNLSETEKIVRNDKRTKTVNQKYGGYTLQSPELKKKMKSTMIQKYGVEHPFHSDTIKQKALNTWIKKYGVDNPFKSSNIKEKIKQVLKDRYGVDNSANVNPEIRVNKGIETKIERGWIIPDEFLSDYQIYRKKVKRLTETTYKTYKNIINPNNLERVTNGKNGYQLDHKYSIIEGFLNNVEPEIISHHCNLQMIEWSSNRAKSKRCDIDLEQLKNEIKSYE